MSEPQSSKYDIACRATQAKNEWKLVRRRRYKTKLARRRRRKIAYLSKRDFNLPLQKFRLVDFNLPYFMFQFTFTDGRHFNLPLILIYCNNNFNLPFIFPFTPMEILVYHPTFNLLDFNLPLKFQFTSLASFQFTVVLISTTQFQFTHSNWNFQFTATQISIYLQIPIYHSHFNLPDFNLPHQN